MGSVSVCVFIHSFIEQKFMEEYYGLGAVLNSEDINFLTSTRKVSNLIK